MTKTPITDLTNPQLDEWCAKAQKLTQISEFYWIDENGNAVYDGIPYSPTTNDAQVFELADKFGLLVNFINNQAWYKGQMISAYNAHHGRNVRQAICRAVIASVYGEYVEVEDD